MVKDISIAIGIAVIQLSLVFGGMGFFIFTMVNMMMWFSFLGELEIMDERHFIGIIIVYAIFLTSLIPLGHWINNWLEDWHKAYKDAKPHMEVFHYPDGNHIELSWVDGEYEAVELTARSSLTKQKLEIIEARLKAEVQGRKQVSHG